MLRIRAGRVYPVTGPPLDDGAVLVDRAGRIAAVGPHAAVPDPPDAERLEFPDGTLVPGLVNCHTHLELSHLAGRNTERGFARWIRRVRELKEASSREEFLRSAEEGLRACWAQGVTCLADTGSTGAAMEALRANGGRGVAYHEVFGPDPGRLSESVAELRVALAHLGRLASDRLRLGVSPHAPYTVSAPLYREVAELARAEELPLAVHLAESREEVEFVQGGEGPFAAALRARGIPVEARRCSPVAYLAERGILTSRTLCIHCVQVDQDDVQALARAGAAIAHCPRSNRAHGHGAAPLATFRSAGVRVGLGTDSVVSVGDLNLWAEAGAAGLEGEDALRMLTLEGAQALGWQQEIGSLEVGKAADIAVLPSLPLSRPSLPSAALLTVVSGRIVYRG